MRKLATVIFSFFLIMGVAFADSSKDANPKPAEPAKPKAAKKPAAVDAAAIAAELEELRQTMQSQQEEIQQLKDALAKRDQRIDEARETAASANAHAAEAAAKASEAITSSAKAETSTAVLNTTVADLKASNDALKGEVSGAGSPGAEEAPASIHIKGITITPGGFIAAESVYRTRATSSDINTPFTNIPFPGNGLSKESEFNGTGRQSRLSFLFQGKADNVAMTGYYELDWLGACATSNNRQSNSYCMRQRQIWGQAALPSGWTFTGGQMWSLATETSKGLDNRTEILPMTIDPQYSVGFTWARQYGFRVTKNFDNKFWLGASVEGPQVTLTAHNVPTALYALAPGNGGGLYNGTDSTGYSVNASPDFILKAAFEPGWGHYEVFGILSNFRARIYPCDLAAGSLTPPADCAGAPASTGAFNDTRTGGGIGVNLRMPLVAKKVSLGLHFLGGDGVGRYSSAQLKDVTARPDGTLAPIRGGSFLGTLELHPSPKFDLYFNYGVEYAARAAYTYTNLADATVAVGYGSPLFNQSGCEAPEAAPTPGTVNAPASAGGCTGDLRNVQEYTVGFWHHIYHSSAKGELRWGMQYSYISNATWSGNNNTPTDPGVNGKSTDNMVFTSFRYYIP